MRRSDADGPELSPEAASELVATVAAALAEARAPRQAKQLKQAAKVLEAAGDADGAATALNVLASLELTRGRAVKALSHARAAARVAVRMGAPCARLDALSLQARALAAMTDWPRATKAAEEHARGLRDHRPDAHPEGVALLARLRWAQDDLTGALELISEVSAVSEVPHLAAVEAALFVCAGCPTGAIHHLTQLLRRAELSDGAAESVLLARGWAHASVGRSDRAARDFRKIIRSARADGNRSSDAIACAALAAVQLQDGAAQEDTPGTRRAHAALSRAVRLTRRVRDPRASRAVAAAQSAIDAQAGGNSGDRQAAAQGLVAQAKRTANLRFVEACILETERLTSLPEGQPPYTRLDVARAAVGAAILAL